MNKQEQLIAEVVRNITREKNVQVTIAEKELLIITVYLSARQSVYFCKKVNERLFHSIIGAYKLMFIEYQYNGEVIYNFTYTVEGKKEGYAFKEV